MTPFPPRGWPRTVGPFLVFAALAVAVLLLVRAAAPDHRSATPSPSASTEPPGPVDTPPPSPPTPLSTLLAASNGRLAGYAGTPVTTKGVRVLRRLSPNVTWVGRTLNSRVLVLLVGTERPFRFTAGTTLAFTGTIRPADAATAHQLGLRGDDAATLARAGGYVEIESYVTT